MASERIAEDSSVMIIIKSAETDQEFISSMKSIYDCGICKDLLVQAASLRCSHTFCHSCIYKWLDENTSCPVCRQYARRSQLKASPMIVNETANKLACRLLTEEEQSERLERGRVVVSAALPAVGESGLVGIESSPESDDERDTLATLSGYRPRRLPPWFERRDEGAGG